MSTEPNQATALDPPPEQDITPSEREALLRDTLQNLLEAFSAPDDEDDAGTTTELHQNAAEAPSDLSGETP